MCSVNGEGHEIVHCIDGKGIKIVCCIYGEDHELGIALVGMVLKSRAINNDHTLGENVLSYFF